LKFMPSKTACVSSRWHAHETIGAILAIISVVIYFVESAQGD
jgi:multisubunit Na+/H+ antiporter MnhG subunit